MLPAFCFLFLALPQTPAQKDPGVWLEQARTHAKNGERELAVKAAGRAETLVGRDARTLQELANFYASIVPDYPKAAKFGARYAENAPQDRTAWQRLAAFCLSTNQPVEAAAAAEHALRIEDSPEIHTLLANAYARLFKWPLATEHFRLALKARPFDEQSHFALAQAYLQQQDFPSAIHSLEDARKVFDKSPQIELALGVAYYGQRNFAAAVDQFLRTIRLAPDVPQPYSFLSRMMDHLGDRMPEAIERFAEYEKQHPGEYLGYLVHAQALIARLPGTGDAADADTALQLLRKAAALNDRIAETHYNLGILLERQRDDSAAAAEFERAIEINPKLAAPHFRLARIYGRLGRSAESEQQRALHQKLSDEENNPAPPPVPGGRK